MNFDKLESEAASIELSRQSVILHGPFVDYSTFEGYLSQYSIPVFDVQSLDFGSRLGSGAIWTVFKGRVATSEGVTDVAIKRLNLALPQTHSDVEPYKLELREQLAVASLEVRALTTPALRSHRNIAKLLGVSWEAVASTHDARLASRRPLLLMELAELSHPTLDALLQSPSGPEVALAARCSLIADVADALTVVHACGIIHGDLKPGNILIFRNEESSGYIAKLSDFGGCQPSAAGAYDSSQITADLEIFPLGGTRLWNAPEVARKDEQYFRNKLRDYYSFGLVIYFTLFGGLPFNSPNGSANVQATETDTHDSRMVSAVAQNLHEFLQADKASPDIQPFVLALAIVVLLRYSPEFRAKNAFVRDCRAFLNDEYSKPVRLLRRDSGLTLPGRPLGTHIQRIVEEGRWDELISEYQDHKIDLFHFSSTVSRGQGFFAVHPEYSKFRLSVAQFGDREKNSDATTSTSSGIGSHFTASEAEALLLKSLLDMPQSQHFVQKLRENVGKDEIFTEIAVNACLSEQLRTSVVGDDIEFNAPDGPWETLVTAVSGGQETAVENCLKATHGDLKECMVQGFNVLHIAAWRGHAGVVRVILEDGRIDISARADNGLDALTMALNSLHWPVAEILNAHSASKTTVLNLGTLQFLANYGNLKCLSLLEEFVTEALDDNHRKSFWKGESKDWPCLSPDEEPDFPPVIAAIFGSNSAALWFLLERGSSPDAEFQTNAGGHFMWLKAIHLAAQLRPLHLALLLHYGANVNERTRGVDVSEPFGRFTALHLACTTPAQASYVYPWVQKRLVDSDVDPEAHRLGPFERNIFRQACIKLLVHSSPSTLETKDKAGLTALAHCMSIHKDQDADTLGMATTLIDLGADCSVSDNQGLSCLHRAVFFSRDVRLVTLLLDRGADINARDHLGYTPLAAAAVHGCDTIASLLLKRGADIRRLNKQNYDVVSLALGARHFQVFNTLFEAAEKQNHLAELLFIHDDDVKQTLFMRICRMPNLHTYLHRLPRQSVIDHINDNGLMKYTALHHSVVAGNTEAVQYLLSLGADINAQAYREMTAAHIAYGLGQKPMIDLLAKWNPDLSKRDDRGWTPEDYAAQRRLKLSFWDEIQQDILEHQKQLEAENDTQRQTINP